MSQRVILPNGLSIWCINADEALSIYHEVQEYFDKGLEVYPGDVVVDIGANVGLFSLAVSQRTKSQATLYAFEPIPATFYALKHNTARYSNIHSKQMGLADTPGTLRFTFYPYASASSTAFPESDRQQQIDRGIFFLKSVPNLARYRWLLGLPKPLLRLQQSLSVRMVYRGTSIKCEVDTVSGFMAKQGLERIDLLKIDAEKAEVPILKGIAETDWPKINRLAIEVHDLKHDLPWIENLLESKGFRITQRFYGYGSEESGVATLYAARGSAGEAK